MSLREKYDPTDHDGDDIYTCIHDEAMAVLTQPSADTKPTALALHVIGRLALDPEDLPLIKQLVIPIFPMAKDPEIVANWRKVKAMRDLL